MKSESRAYHVWSENEEQALREGVRRYGVGSWEPIRQDKSFSILKQRSGVQLKDKWRNLVKFQKVDGKELENLPRRATGPWSKKADSSRAPAKFDGISASHVSIKRGGEDRRFGIYDLRRYSRETSSEDSDLSTHECDNAVVSCPCGIDADDGQSMIECEKCKEWAHTQCLSTIKEQKTLRHYICEKCRRRRSSEDDEHSTWHPDVSQPNDAAQDVYPLAKDLIPFHSFHPFGGLSVTTAVCMLTELRNSGYGMHLGKDEEDGPGDGVRHHSSSSSSNPRKRKHPAAPELSI